MLSREAPHRQIKVCLRAVSAPTDCAPSAVLGNFPVATEVKADMKGAFLVSVGLLMLARAGPGQTGRTEPTTTSARAQAAAAPHDAAWVDGRVAAWQPTAHERSWEQIGWAKDIRGAERLARERGRPVFLFTHDGRLGVGRC